MVYKPIVVVMEDEEEVQETNKNGHKKNSNSKEFDFGTNKFTEEVTQNLKDSRKKSKIDNVKLAILKWKKT